MSLQLTVFHLQSFLCDVLAKLRSGGFDATGDFEYDEDAQDDDIA